MKRSKKIRNIDLKAEVVKVVKKVHKIHTFSATLRATDYCLSENANYGVQINAFWPGEVVLCKFSQSLHKQRQKLTGKTKIFKYIYVYIDSDPYVNK